MKIKMLVSFAGAGFSASPGDEIDRPDAEAIRLVQKGYAVPVSGTAIETTDVKPAETRAPARKTRRSRKKT